LVRDISGKKAEKLNLKGYKKHIVFCDGASCTASIDSEGLWDYLKHRLDVLGLANSADSPVFRTKAKCLRVCSQGAIAVVYPEGIWYRNLDKKGIDRLINEHLIAGKPVSEYILERNEGLIDGGLSSS
jgi:(2Fe-2S) ferredoxin